MKRMLVCVFAWSVLALGIARAVPARPLYEPEEPPKPPPMPNLRGTTWMGKDLVANRVIFFEPDGGLRYGINKPTLRNGTWKMEGPSLYFEINKKYREFRGTVNGDKIIGESWNKVGKRWETILNRVPEVK